MLPITFTDTDLQGVDQEQDDPMVMTIAVENFTVKKVLIYQGSLVDILHWATYQKLQVSIEAMIPYDERFYGFSSERVCTRKYIDLHAIFYEGQ